MVDRREDDGTGVIVLENPNDPVPQTKVILPDGTVVEGKDLADMTDEDFAAMVDLGTEEDDAEFEAACQAPEDDDE
jgi:hypothetical protein